MPNSDRDRVQIGRKLRRSLEFIRNRGPASMTPENAAWQAQIKQVGQGQIPSSGTHMQPPQVIAEQPRANPNQMPPFDPRMLQQPPPIILPGVRHRLEFPPPTSGALSEKQEMNRHASKGYRQTAWSTEQEPRRWNGSHTTPPEHGPGNGGTQHNFNPASVKRGSRRYSV